MRAILFGLLLGMLPAFAGAQDLSSQRDYSDPLQRDRPIACKPGDREHFPGKTIADVFGGDWPAQPVPVAPDAHAPAAMLARGPIRWPRGLDPQGSFTVVAVLVGADGAPLRAEILCSTRIGLDAAVRRQSMASTYSPAQVNGAPVTSVLVRVVSVKVGERARSMSPPPIRD